MDELNEIHPLVSIILPTYNRAELLGRAISSVILQDYKNWELMIVDNYSHDGTDAVVENFKDSRIRLLKIQNDGVIGKSRNHGIRNSTGQWLAFLDSDDWWLPSKLSICIAECGNSTDLLYHDLAISKNGKILKWNKISGWALNKPVINDLLLKGNAIANSTVMVRREIIERIGYISEDININPSVDYNTWLKVARVTNSFKYIPKVLGVYLIHAGGVSQRDMSISHNFAIADFLGVLTKFELESVHNQVNYIHGRYLYESKNYASAEAALKKCMLPYDLNIFIKSIISIILIKLKTL